MLRLRQTGEIQLDTEIGHEGWSFIYAYIYALWAASLESSGACNDWGNDGDGTVSESNSALIRLPSQSETTGPNLSCRWARFAIVSLRPVVLDLGV